MPTIFSTSKTSSNYLHFREMHMHFDAGRWSLCPHVNLENLDNRRWTLCGGTLSAGCDSRVARPIEQLKEHGTLTVIIPLSSGSRFWGQRCFWNTAGLAISMIEFGLDPSIDCVQWPQKAPHEKGPPHLTHGLEESICTQTHSNTHRYKQTQLLGSLADRLIYTHVTN